jgi:hypothetical protein
VEETPIRRGPGSYQYRVKPDRRGPAGALLPPGFSFLGLHWPPGRAAGPPNGSYGFPGRLPDSSALSLSKLDGIVPDSPSSSLYSLLLRFDASPAGDVGGLPPFSASRPHIFRVRAAGLPVDRNEPDLNPLVQRSRNSPQHRKRVPLVVRILKAADCRRRGAYLLGQFPLAQSGLRPQTVKALGDLDVEEFLFVRRILFGIAGNESAMRILKCCGLGILFHRNYGLIVGLKEYRPGFPSNFFFRSTARWISCSGTAPSFTTPCETTTILLRVPGVLLSGFGKK